MLASCPSANPTEGPTTGMTSRDTNEEGTLKSTAPMSSSSRLMPTMRQRAPRASAALRRRPRNTPTRSRTIV
jgi:hypothetical protein